MTTTYFFSGPAAAAAISVVMLTVDVVAEPVTTRAGRPRRASSRRNASIFRMRGWLSSSPCEARVT